MDLPDCPPGTEGYEDTVSEITMKPDETCTKAEKEFQDHLNSLKIIFEDGEVRCMVQRNRRDVSGMWSYVCLPCAAICSGEHVLQNHISGKKHKNKLSLRSIWPKSILELSPVSSAERGSQKTNEEQTYVSHSSFDGYFSKYQNVPCHIQSALNAVKRSMVGVEYLIEHPPERPHCEPSYLCSLCNKQGHPRTIINHMTSFWHNTNFIKRHFSKADSLLSPYRGQVKYRQGTLIVMNRLLQRIQDTYGRMLPLHMDKDEYDRNKEEITRYIFKSKHFNENDGPTFEEVIDVNLIDSLNSADADFITKGGNSDYRDPSPPVVAAPTKPLFNSFKQSANRRHRRANSMDSLSDISDTIEEQKKEPSPYRNKSDSQYKSRYEPYPNKNKAEPYRSRYSLRNETNDNKKHEVGKKNGYKYELAEEKRLVAVGSAKKILAYHEKNPEKHPLYPEEWKKFWNKRYKEIQAEGKDPSKHDFKPEWILYWTKRMKELHDEELRIQVNEINRRLCISPSDLKTDMVETRRSPDKRRSPEVKRRSADVKRRSADVKRRSPDVRRRSPDARRRSPQESKRRSPELKRRSPTSQRISDRRRLADPRRDYRRELRSRSRSAEYRRSPGPRRSPPPSRQSRQRSRSPREWRRSSNGSSRPVIQLDRGGSPLSQRDAVLQLRNRSPEIAPSLQTVFVSDDDLDPELGSSISMTDRRSRADSEMSRALRTRRDTQDDRNAAQTSLEFGPDPQDMGPPENVVATLRLLVALEDYLGSLGPKIVDLLTEALKMEKIKANSSEMLLDRDSALVLIETSKEKLKGAVQAGLVNGSAAVAAVRAAVVRAAATIHAADSRTRRPPAQEPSTSRKEAVPVAGIGEVDRAQIAKQMAEALIAQGKTDVTAEELSQLVDAVVGMAEAKKMESQKSKIMTARSFTEQRQLPVKRIGTASALQLLQSAYNENDKKIEKMEAPDAMDGLSDSDLETLLKNFNELSSEEQHSLIAYLKKLEAREPQRVERLRQYVSATAPNAAPILQGLPTKEDVAPVTIQSDDDDEDYTVEEVFQSATQKVKEDQIRQEMEIVKKSLETKPTGSFDLPATTSVMDITRNISSASDLLALVQASIQSTSVQDSAVQLMSNIVTTNTQPRSFGDLPEPSIIANEPRPLMQNLIQINTSQTAQSYGNNQHMNQPQNLNRPVMQNRMNFESNRMPINYNQAAWNQQNNMANTRAATPVRPSNYDNYYNHSQYNNQMPQDNFNGRQDNYETGPTEMNQQYGGYQDLQYQPRQQNKFRGRGGGSMGRGNQGGTKRGRGRGGYYQ